MAIKTKPQRRFSWKKVLVLALLALIPLTVYQVGNKQIFNQQAAESTKPNVIIILTDDQPDGTMQYLPYTADHLGKNGVTFTNAYVTTGLCCPSRSSILTGQYAHNHGVLNNRPPNGGVKKFNDKETLPVWLQRAGYKTALIGKYLNEYDSIAPYIPPGWDDWIAFDDDNGKYFDYKLTKNKKSQSFGDKPEDYSTDVFAREAVGFIKKTKEPFFLYFAPHAPHGVPRPAPRDENNCDNAQLKKGPDYNEDDVSDKPKWIRDLPKLTNKEVKDQEDEFKAKMCTLKAVDDAVKDILQALGSKRDNTMIIFLSDNGFVFGEHRWAQKECFYEGCIAVDMIISYPPITAGKQTSDQFALNIDLAPTILDAAGVRIPSSVDGKSLIPLLKKPTTKIHDNFLIETYDNEGNPKGEDYGIREGSYKYQELFTGERELYDLATDRYEVNNLANDPAYNAIKQQLAIELYLQKQKKTSDLPPAQNPPQSDNGDNGDNGNGSDEPYNGGNTNPPISKKSGDVIQANDPANLKCIEDGKDGVVTEVGCIPKDPAGFAAAFYRIGLGLIAGVALLFIIIGGYLLLTSRGDPVKIHNGRTYIFYALFGLGLAIFGFIFLQVISVDILHIPGFGA